jgi:very-short-patch-repair endonuclease
MSRIGNNQSYMERTFEEWLIQHGITNFNKEHHFFNPHLNKHYFVDFMFPELMLIIELDGDHHKLLIEQDAIRDAYLLSIGYNIIRINQREYRHQLKLQQVSDALGI